MLLLTRISVAILAITAISCGDITITSRSTTNNTTTPTPNTSISPAEISAPPTDIPAPPTDTPAPPTRTPTPGYKSPLLPTHTPSPTNTPAPTLTATPADICQQLEVLDPDSPAARAIAEDAIATGPVGKELSLSGVVYAYRLQGWVIIFFGLNIPADGLPFVMRPLGDGRYETAAIIPPVAASEEDVVTQVQSQAADAPPDLVRCWSRVIL